MPNPRVGLKEIVSLTENVIRCETLTIVRVQRYFFDHPRNTPDHYSKPRNAPFSHLRKYPD